MVQLRVCFVVIVCATDLSTRVVACRVFVSQKLCLVRVYTSSKNNLKKIDTSVLTIDEKSQYCRRVHFVARQPNSRAESRLRTRQSTGAAASALRGVVSLTVTRFQADFGSTSNQITVSLFSVTVNESDLCSNKCCKY